MSGGTGDASAEGSPGTEGGTDAGACTVTPEGEIGPYFADDSAAGFNRSNILTNLDGTNAQTGIPLTLDLTILDSGQDCAPYVDAQVDIWHCNAAGVYSDQASEDTSAEQWLRGYQTTDADGKVTFVTIVPGWYSGRTTHIHFRIRSTYSTASSTSDGTNTTQAFFDQTFIDTLATSVAPYDGEGQNPTTNASDRVYSTQTDGANVLVLSGDNTNGYVAALTLVLPITSSGTSTVMEGGAPPGFGDGGGPPGFGEGGGPPSSQGSG
jgi:protocatechuate 3,4-dioxygenase beta subunit